MQQIDLSDSLSVRSKEDDVVSSSICSIVESSESIALSQNVRYLAIVDSSFVIYVYAAD